ncbi:ribonuclease H-like domain-containing protein [Tanacetum coccineum]
MSTRDKFGLGYGNQIHEGVLSYEKEVLESVFDSRSSDVEDSPVYDRFVKVEGMHAVPPLMIGNYMPPKSDSDDEYVIEPLKEQEKPSFAFFITVKRVKTPRETVKEQNIGSPSPKVNKRDWNGLMSKKLGLGYRFTKKACFVYGSFSHLIRDCDFHKKRMAKQVELNKNKVNTARQNPSNQAAETSTARKVNTARPIDDPQKALKNKGIVDSGCSRHMTGNKAYLMCDKKNKVLFTDTKCLMLSPDFMLPDENQVLLRVPKQNNMYSFNLENVVPTEGLACLIVKATVDESNKWHRRLGHVNFKNLNKLVKGNLIRGLPSKIFQNDHTCVACQKGKQHKASWKGPNWLFDLDYLTDSMNYQPVTAENKANKTAGPKEANHIKSSEARNGDVKLMGNCPNSSDDPKAHEGDQVQSSHDSPFSGDHTSEKAKGGLKLEELFILCTNLSNRVLAFETSKDAQAAEIIKLKTRIKKLKKKSHPVISHHKAWLRSVSRLSMKRKSGRKESVSKQGRKNAKPKPTLDAFDDRDVDGRDYMETEDVVKEERQSNKTEEFNKGSSEKGGSTEGPVNTIVPKTVSTARPDVDAARQDDSVVEPRTPPTTTSIFNDEDITMAQTLIKMKEEKDKEKGVSIKDVTDSSRPARSTLTLKPLPTIDPKDKGKSVLEEPEPAKKMTRSDFDDAQIERDAEIARQLQVDLQVKVERERQREEEASKAANAEMYDEVQAGIDADALFAAKIQQEEREEYTIEERAKFLAKTIVAQRKFKAAQRSAEIRSRPSTKSQLRNLMMTYLKNMGGYKHSHLKAKSFEEIKGMYERHKKFVQDFVPIGSAKEEELIKKMNEKATDEDTLNKEKVLEEPDSTKVKVKQEGHEDSTRKRTGRRLKMKATKKSKRQKTDSDLEEDEQLKAFLVIVPDEKGIIDYEVLEKRFLIINWESKFYEFDRHRAECIYYRIFRSDGSSREKRFETSTPEGIDLILWGSLRTMFEANAEDDLWKNQEEWILKSWNFYDNCGVHILRMLALRLIAEFESKAVFDLLRFIQQQIDESGSHDGSEKDL